MLLTTVATTRHIVRPEARILGNVVGGSSSNASVPRDWMQNFCLPDDLLEVTVLPLKGCHAYYN